MKVRLIKRITIEKFSEQHADSRGAFSMWLAFIKYADWTIPENIQDTFGSADLLGNGSNRVVFNIAGNHYRMICKYHFGATRVHLYVKWIGTHTAYSKLCKEKEQYTVNIY